MTKMNMRRFEKLVERKVRKAIGVTTTHRVYVKDMAITASTTKNIELLKADDDPDYDLVSNGTNIAECHSNSRITKMQLMMQYYNSTGAGLTVEQMLFKAPDGQSAADFTPANLWVSDFEITDNMVKKFTVMYKADLISATFETVKGKIFIKRAALKRIRTMRDNDALIYSLIPPAGTTQVLNLMGRIWTTHA